MEPDVKLEALGKVINLALERLWRACSKPEDRKPARRPFRGFGTSVSQAVHLEMENLIEDLLMMPNCSVNGYLQAYTNCESQFFIRIVELNKFLNRVFILVD